jgi:hypothetical protein
LPGELRDMPLGSILFQLPGRSDDRAAFRATALADTRFPRRKPVPANPTRGALAVFEGGRTIPHEAVGGRKSFYGLVF